MQAELAKAFGIAALGASLGIVGTLYSKTESGWAAVIAVAALLFVAGFMLIYSARVSRREFLDGYDKCSMLCGRHVPRRDLWRLPGSGTQTCSVCFITMMGRAPHELLGYHHAFLTKSEERARLREQVRRDAKRQGERRRVDEATTSRDPQSPQSPKHDP